MARFVNVAQSTAMIMATAMQASRKIRFMETQTIIFFTPLEHSIFMMSK
jgi:hypothetical protein